MKSSDIRLLCAAGVLVVLLGGFAGLGLTGSGKAVARPASGVVTPEAHLLTDTQKSAFWFFVQGEIKAGEGPGLFDTDFFKPAPAPKVAPKPTPPTTREAALIYRGLAVFPDGSRVAYLALDGRTLNPGVGDEIADGWKLGSFDSEQAELVKGEARLTLPFNRRTAVTVPAKP